MYAQPAQTPELPTPSPMPLTLDSRWQSAKEGEDLQLMLTIEPEGEGMDEVTQRLEVILSEFKGQVLTELKNQRGDLQSIYMKLDTMMPRREADMIHKDVERRLESLENDRQWLSRQIVLIWFAGIPTAGAIAIALLKKFI